MFAPWARAASPSSPAPGAPPGGAASASQQPLRGLASPAQPAPCLTVTVIVTGIVPSAVWGETQCIVLADNDIVLGLEEAFTPPLSRWLAPCHMVHQVDREDAAGMIRNMQQDRRG
mmetsp:Transcript_14974/g.45200  ORF Transcript_14974/g.45200 Transcript_14974/m.45200 type:complete len:116 (-) Transcript_14974:179-526(-)